MQLFNGVIYDSKPQDVIVYPTMVDVLLLCDPVNVVDENTNKTVVKFKCNIERYTTSEYIDKLSIENKSLNMQVTEAQIAIIEVYELTIG